MYSKSIKGRTVVLVGDSPITAGPIRQFFIHVGAIVLSTKQRSEALRLAEDPKIWAVVLDADWNKDDSEIVCWRLMERSVPFFFYGGTGNPIFHLWPSNPNQATAALAE